ncbi:energy-converting hydrogenase Eha subunit A [Modestobacter versicolor]|uniref:Energy-converting hydrogenase Eha subunit A n=1 Tax=Modestobacter versicolor TaxID=429133 RepID=A0A839Y3E2_9ACTN|nr:hypothetical protein [Modestobacter versicolor]MBB3674293.1 energy-converting hydrogenase Eha subunit A [Modestobacter versicolor]
MTNAVTAGRLAGTPAAPPTPQEARTTWPRMAVLGAALLALGVLALTWTDGGPRVLLGALGLFAVVRGVAVLRGVRAGLVERAGAVTGAGAVWVGLVAVGLALLSLTAASWVLVVAVVLVLPVLAAALPDHRGPLLAGAAVVALAAVGVGVLGGVDELLGAGRTAAAVLAGLLGLANLAGAAGMARIARRPEPAPAAGCGGCACGAGGCGSLR